MLEIRKTALFSRDYVAVVKNKVVAELSRNLWRQRGEMDIDGKTFRFQRDGTFKSKFSLMDSDQVLIEVEQPSTFKSGLVFRYADKEYQMVKKAWYSRTFIIKHKNKVLGSIERKTVFSSTTLVDLPKDYPLAMAVFIGWIAMVRWDDETAAAAAG